MRTFTELSKKVTDSFIQNIIFIDDKAYNNGQNDQHEFDAQEVTEIFSRKVKFVQFISPR